MRSQSKKQSMIFTNHSARSIRLDPHAHNLQPKQKQCRVNRLGRLWSRKPTKPNEPPNLKTPGKHGAVQGHVGIYQGARLYPSNASARSVDRKVWGWFELV